MKIQFNNIKFGDGQRIYRNGYNKIKERYNDDNVLISRIEYDEYGRDLDSKHFDKSGAVTSHLHKEYTENGYIENFKNKYQEYVRKVYSFVENSLKHRVEEYVSKTCPEKNYINDFIYDLSGKLIRIINNGKITDLRR